MKNVVFFAFLLIVGEQVLTKPFRTGNEQIILDEFQAAIDDHQARARQEFETEGSLPLNGELTGDLIQKVEATAGKVTGPQQLMIQATARYLKKLQKREQSYSEASLSFDVEEIILPSALTDRSQLLPYRQRITNFMKANEELKQFTLHSAAHFEAELLQAEIPRASLNHALKGFKSSSAPQLGTLTEIRDQDAALGTNLLAVLDLYDSQWNRWHYDSEAEIAVFQDPCLRPGLHNHPRYHHKFERTTAESSGKTFKHKALIHSPGTAREPRVPPPRPWPPPIGNHGFPVAVCAFPLNRIISFPDGR